MQCLRGTPLLLSSPVWAGEGAAEPGRRRCSGARLGFAGGGALGGSGGGQLSRAWTERKWSTARGASRRPGVSASLMVDPAAWIIRTAVFYVLLETGVAARGRPRTALDADEDESSQGERPFAWVRSLFGDDPVAKKNKELAKVRSKWHSTTKGTLMRKYRVPSKAGGRKLLSAISSILADDDTFRDVATHKGCQIQRENAHAESVCCHNVRALFDELPTPRLVVEITVFPAGPITTAHYEKAERLERVLKTGASI